MSVAYRTYLRRIYDIIEEVLQTQGREIETAAGWMADTIAARGIVHLFGSGHSHMIAEEVFHRAGSLMPLNPILDSNLTLFGHVNATLLERTSGYAKLSCGWIAPRRSRWRASGCARWNGVVGPYWSAELNSLLIRAQP